jgi:hypothetical protein
MIQHAFRDAVTQAGIVKHATCHTHLGLTCMPRNPAPEPVSFMTNESGEDLIVSFVSTMMRRARS